MLVLVFMFMFMFMGVRPPSLPSEHARMCVFLAGIATGRTDILAYREDDGSGISSMLRHKSQVS